MMNHVIPTIQASCCLTCSSLMRGASFTRYWRCSATGCTTSSRTTESSCSATCTAWLLFPRPTRTSSICGNASSTEAVHKVSLKKKNKKPNHGTDGDLSSCVPHRSVESTALRLITALGSSEVQPQFTRFLNDPKTVLSAESEELNRALILTLARATHVTGSTRCGFTDYLFCLKLFRNLFITTCRF